MRKAAIVLIVIGILVVIAANLFLTNPPTPLPPPVADPTTLRHTTSGDYVGFRDKYGARTWQGIPYAQPPIERNRWKSPKAPIAELKVKEALGLGKTDLGKTDLAKIDLAKTGLGKMSPGKMCPQFSSLLSGGTPGSIIGDEDCLYLSIWSPPNAVDLPVMLWIHGGGNTIGHGGSYNGHALATKRGIVVVSINYRLGVFGWFNHPVLHTGDPLDDSGNYGTLDIIRALAWVKNNIVEFGGDPDNVTVFGESAGAFNTLAMMASPVAKGLFHKAIVQSGGFHQPL